MAVTLRLTRYGKKHSPFYRIVAVHKRSKRDGKYVELIGTYNPFLEAQSAEIKKERFDYWVSKGAEISEGLTKLLKNKKKLLFK